MQGQFSIFPFKWEGCEGTEWKFNFVPPAGSMSVLTPTTAGLRQSWKTRWAAYDPTQCKLRLYKTSQELDMVGELDIQTATFTYDLDNENNGMFKLW